MNPDRGRLCRCAAKRKRALFPAKGGRDTAAPRHRLQYFFVNYGTKMARTKTRHDRRKTALGDPEMAARLGEP
jgi:hypothetical protein